MTALTEKDAERHLAAHALTAAYPGFVGLTVDLPPATPGPAAGRSRLRHGFLIAEAGRLVISGPPSPGLDVAVQRMTEDLALAATLIGRAAAARGAGVRVHLEAGTEDHGPTSMRRRWAVAHAVAPVLAAAFANAPVADGPRAGWRSSPRRTAAEPGPDPRAAWAREVLDAPVSAPELSPATFRQWIRHGRGRPPAIADLERHERAFRPPVAARGILEIDGTDRLPGQGWQVAAAVIGTLIDDSQAATEALAATAGLRNRAKRRDGAYLWERAARDALTDPELATAARSLFVSAYGALARRGAPRRLRDAVAAYAEHFVLSGRCPADDQRPTGELHPDGELHPTGELRTTRELHPDGELHPTGELRTTRELHPEGELHSTDNRRPAEIRENRS